MTDAKLKVALVGCGAQAQLAHIPALKANPAVELYALCDTDARKVNHLAALHSVPRRFVDFDELRDVEEIDGVVVATPNHLHAPMAASALAYGKHVLCEMPLGMDSSEVERMVQVADREKRILTPCLNTRLRPDVQTIKRFIAGGELGPLYYAKTGWLQGRESWSLSGWRGERLRAGGGAFLSLGTALLDAALYLLDKHTPVSVIGAAHHRDPRSEVEDTAFAMVRFEPDLLLTVEVGWSLLMEQDFNYLNLMGNSGAALLNPIQIHKEMHGHLVNVTPQIPAKGIQRASHKMLIDLWVDSMLKGRPAAVAAPDALIISRLSDAFYRSAQAHAEVRLDS
jgi:predicted dehydrogenase